MLFFFFPCGRLCSQGLIKVPQDHHGDWWWSGMLSNPSTAVSHLLFYPQSSGTPPSIFHSADALLLIPSPPKRKAPQRIFHMLPSPVHHSLFSCFTGCFFSMSFVSFSILYISKYQLLVLRPGLSVYFLMMFTSIFHCRLSLKTLVYYPSPWCIHKRHVKSHAPRWILV